MAPQGTQVRVSAKARRELWDEINKADASQQELDEEYAEYAEDVDASKGFRWNSPKTQSDQDRIRKLFEAFLVKFKKLAAPGTEDRIRMTQKEVDLICFPVDDRALHQRLGTFLNFVANHGRGRALGSRISFRGYVKYRATLIFWACHYRTVYDLDPPKTQLLFRKLTDVMRYAVKKHKLPLSGPVNQTHIGLAELRMLIDFDLATTANIEVAESHQLGWCFGRFCAVRPQSLGSPDRRSGDYEYLAWKDVEIRRGKEPGEFKVKVEFRNLKTNMTDPQAALNKPVQSRTLRFNIATPTKIENLIFSVPHRLLVIAFRRKILADIDTLDELLNGDQRNIMIKDEFLNDPVLIMSGPRGSTAWRKFALPASSLTTYIQRRAVKLGFHKTITFYSIRRRTATDLSRIIGNDQARLVLNHAPDTQTMELHYVDLLITTNVTAMGVNEPHRADGQDEQLILEESDLAINVLSSNRLKQVYGPPLNALCNIIIENEDPVPRTAVEMRSFQRRVREAALRSLLCKHSQEQRAEITNEEVHRRIAKLDKSKVVDFVVKKAREELTKIKKQEELAERDDTENDDVDATTGLFKTFTSTVWEEEEDIEDQNHIQQKFQDALDGNANATDIVVDENLNVDDELRDVNEGAEDDAQDDNCENVPYAVGVKEFMKALLENSLSGHYEWKSNPVACPKCDEDDTIATEWKDKTYNDQWKYNNHIGGRIHTPIARWERTLEAMVDHSLEKPFVCPYCSGCDVLKEKAKAYKRIEDLIRHVRRSTARLSSAEHDRLKRLDGWYEPGFSESQSWFAVEQRKKRADLAHKQGLAKYNFKYAAYEEREIPLQDPEHSGLGLGGVPPPSKERPSIITGLDLPAEEDELLLAPFHPRHVKHLRRGHHPGLVDVDDERSLEVYRPGLCTGKDIEDRKKVAGAEEGAKMR